MPALPTRRATPARCMAAESGHHDDMAQYTHRRATAEHEAMAWRLRTEDALGQLDRAARLIRQLQQEMQALADALDSPPAAAAEAQAAVPPAVSGAEVDTAPAAGLQAVLVDRRLLFVGGRPSSMGAIRRVAERAGAVWLHHHAGLENADSLAPSLLALVLQADLVALPIDGVDRDGLQRLERHCLRLGRPFHALRTASMGSFVASLLSSLGPGRTPGQQAGSALAGSGADHRAHVLTPQCRR